MEEEHTQPQPNQRPEFNIPEPTDWDAELGELLAEAAATEKISYATADRLNLYATPRGFELVFVDRGATYAFAIDDVQAAQLALAIMTVIANRS